MLEWFHPRKLLWSPSCLDGCMKHRLILQITKYVNLFRVLG